VRLRDWTLVLGEGTKPASQLFVWVLSCFCFCRFNQIQIGWRKEWKQIPLPPVCRAFRVTSQVLTNVVFVPSYSAHSGLSARRGGVPCR
jgi:hypothetical protein